MDQRKVFIACDHGGYALKQDVMKHLLGRCTLIDLGCENSESVDYPDYGHKLAFAIKEAGLDAMGIALCGSGIGISIALNRHKGIRAALCGDVTMAKLSRQHNNANVLVLGGRLIGPVVALDMVDVFLATAFEGGRHQGRIEKLDM